MKIFTLILARGGSKGIPHKNIRPLNGKPLIDYAIQASLGSKVDETWVSTDCSVTASISANCGAKISIRPAKLATDNSPNEETLIDFAKQKDFDVLVSVQPTSPLLLAEDINGGLDLLGNCHSVFSACKEHWVPRWDENFSPIDWDITRRPFRQEMPERYIENGAFYITPKDLLLESGLRYSGCIKPYVMPLKRSFQIDTLEDLDLISSILHEDVHNS